MIKRRFIFIGSDFYDSGKLIYVAPNGQVLFERAATLDSDSISSESFESQFKDQDAVAKMDSSLLDLICEDYTYEYSGQAMRIIDLLTKLGMQTFSGEDKLLSNMDKNLSCGNTYYLLADTVHDKYCLKEPGVSKSEVLPCVSRSELPFSLQVRR